MKKIEKKITLKDLIPGDILMCVGINKVSKMVIALDGGKYSHAALCYDKDHFVHTSTEGTTKHSFEEKDVLLDVKSAIDVFRYQFKEVDNGSSYEDLSKAVIHQAEWYLESDTMYSFGRLALLAFLTTSKKLDYRNKALDLKLLTKYIDQASEWLAKIFKTKKKKALICSEFIYRCYGEAESEKTDYKLEINTGFPTKPFGITFGSNSGFSLSSGFDEFDKRKREELARFMKSRDTFIDLLEEYTDLEFEGFEESIAGFTFRGKKLTNSALAHIITPRNLAASPEVVSPSLKYIGKLK